MNTGKAIRLVRTSLNLRQSVVAKKAGISASYLSLIEKGRREPTLPLLRRLSKVLKISPAIFLALSGDPKQFSSDLKLLHSDFTKLFELLTRIK